LFNFIGEVIGVGLMIFIVSPLLLIIYLIKNSKIDIDGDGKDDVPWRWKR
jgi:hypothetical protein